MDDSSAPGFRVLHLSFHQGCINEIEWLAGAMSLQLTSWYIPSCENARPFDGCSEGSALYNIGRERARRVWELHEKYFRQFDVVITSDTAPLARIFLQNAWTKPLIVWICNRFDYSDQATLDCDFPDERYYELFRAATSMENVRLVSYTRYEQLYAGARGVDIGDRLIRPSGGGALAPGEPVAPLVPSHVARSDTLFLYPRLSEDEVRYVVKSCERAGITLYHGSYRCPEDLEDFRGVLYFPYAYSNFALFENIQLGIVHFVPDEDFLRALGQQPDTPMRVLPNLGLCEWYAPENRDLFVYFRSWEDLSRKLRTTPYPTLRRHIRNRARVHQRATLHQWHKVFAELTPFAPGGAEFPQLVY